MAIFHLAKPNNFFTPTPPQGYVRMPQLGMDAWVPQESYLQQEDEKLYYCEKRPDGTFGKEDITSTLGKDLLDAITDVGKTVAYLAVAPINSVTGHTYDPGFSEGFFGKFGGNVGKIGIDSIHTVGKTFADTISFGYATKAVNLIRSEENKEEAYNYHEQQLSNLPGILGTFEKLSKGGAQVIGSLFGAKALASGAGKIATNVNEAANVLGVGSAGEVPVSTGIPVAQPDHLLPSNAPNTSFLPESTPAQDKAQASSYQPFLIGGIILAVLLMAFILYKALKRTNA